MAEPGPPSSQLFSSSYSLASTYDNSSTSSTASIQGSFTPGAGRSGPASRPSSGPNYPRSQQVPLTPGSEMRSAGYAHSYDPAAPAGFPVSGYSDFVHRHGSGPGSPNMSHAHLSAVGLQAQKRAYRQRRKDPSCDACRERKVKCDATDTSSCSECSSRNVKCQFTKETNRRMSSIKQVQDLEKQLAHARQQLSHLRSVTKDSETGESLTLQRSSLHPPRSEPTLQGVHNLRSIADFAEVRSNLHDHGRGIFKQPSLHNEVLSESPSTSISSLPELPPKAVADDLLRQYHASFHLTLPILHWPSFTHKYEEVYREGSLKRAPRIWSSLLFVVFGCGNLVRSWKDCWRFLEVSKALIDIWTDDVSVNHVQCAILSSMVLVEMNLKSAGWTWLGCAIRFAQDIGLHREAGTHSAADEEMCRRIWWSLYSSDRLLSLEMGRPPMINDNDCEVGFPSPVNERYPSTDDERIRGSESRGPLLPTLQVIRATSQLIKALRASTLTPSVLHSFDSVFGECVAAFPTHHQVRSDGYLEPYSLPPLFFLQNARLILHRHNLGVMSPPEARFAAIHHCVAVAQDTARLLSRCMQNPPETLRRPRTDSDKWEVGLASAASTFFCTHIWRCTLFLCFRGAYDAALLCARASAVIGDARPINIACGKYLEFFLRRMTSKLQHGEGVHLDTDEEMIAYVSADLQGSVESSWVWQGAENDNQLSQRFKHSVSTDPAITGSNVHGAAIQGEDGGWTGWDRILEILEQLIREQQQLISPEFPPRMQQDPAQTTSSRNPSSLQDSPISSNRISIASII